MGKNVAHEQSDQRALFHAFIDSTGTVLGVADIRELEERQRLLTELARRLRQSSTFHPEPLTGAHRR